MRRIRVLSLNIHKGLSHFNLRDTLDSIRTQIRQSQADLVFLQEVKDLHAQDDKAGSRLEYLADQVWSHYAYGKNSVYSDGHHGNAILSKFPIQRWNNIDLTLNRFERRGLLHCVISFPDTGSTLDCFTLHLNLLHSARTKQITQVCDLIEKAVPKSLPFLLAGDFNDWNQALTCHLRNRLGASEAFEAVEGKSARTYPSFLPLLRLDRIYFRGLEVTQTRTLREPDWIRSSDHLALVADFEWRKEENRNAAQ